MTNDATPVSKVLVLEDDPASQDAIRHFCLRHRLQGHKVREHILHVLGSSLDLGAIFLPQRIGGQAHAGIELGRKLHALRPELPIFLRLDDAQDPLLPADVAEVFAATYRAGEIERLAPVVQQTIFNLVYPTALVGGIMEITRGALASQFKGLALQIDAPTIVRDRLIFGEIFTLIPIESHWCRGFMTLQTEEAGLQAMVRAGRTHLAAGDAEDFRSLNSVLGELTNLIWGAFKGRYDDAQPRAGTTSQVPIVVNHRHRYISFGSSNPQLCFRCTLSAADDPTVAPLVVYQRFVFNLNWSPDDFRENDTTADGLVASGELELF